MTDNVIVCIDWFLTHCIIGERAATVPSDQSTDSEETGRYGGDSKNSTASHAATGGQVYR